MRSGKSAEYSYQVIDGSGKLNSYDQASYEVDSKILNAMGASVPLAIKNILNEHRLLKFSSQINTKLASFGYLKKSTLDEIKTFLHGITDKSSLKDYYKDIHDSSKSYVLSQNAQKQQNIKREEFNSSIERIKNIVTFWQEVLAESLQPGKSSALEKSTESTNKKADETRDAVKAESADNQGFELLEQAQQQNLLRHWQKESEKLAAANEQLQKDLHEQGTLLYNSQSRYNLLDVKYKNTVEELKSKREELNKSIDREEEISITSDHSAIKVSNLDDQLSKKHDEIFTLKQQIKTIEQEKVEIKHQMQNLEYDMQQAQKQFDLDQKALKNESRELEKLYQGTLQTNSSLADINNQQEVTIEEQTTQISILENKFQQLQNDFRKQINTKELELQTAQTELTQLRDGAEVDKQLAIKNQQLENRIIELQQEINQAAEKYKKIERENTENKEALDHANHLNNKLKVLNADLTSHVTLLEENQKNASELQQKITQQQETITILEKDIKLKEQEIGRITQTIGQERIEGNNKSVEWNKQKDEFLKILDEKDKRVAQLETDLSLKELEIEQLRKNGGLLDAELSALKDSFAAGTLSQDEKIIFLEGQVNSLRAEITQAQHEKIQAEMKLNEFLAEHGDTAKTSAEINVVELQQQLEGQKQTLASQNNLLAELESENEALKQQLLQAQDMLATVAADLPIDSSEIDINDVNLEELEEVVFSHYTPQKAEDSSLSDSSVESDSKEVQALRTRIALLREQQKTFTSDTAVAEILKHNESLQESYGELLQKLQAESLAKQADLYKQLQAESGNLEAKDREITSIKSAVEELTQELVRQKNANKALQSENERLNAALKEQIEIVEKIKQGLKAAKPNAQDSDFYEKLAEQLEAANQRLLELLNSDSVRPAELIATPQLRERQFESTIGIDSPVDIDADLSSLDLDNSDQHIALARKRSSNASSDAESSDVASANHNSSLQQLLKQKNAEIVYLRDLLAKLRDAYMEKDAGLNSSNEENLAHQAEKDKLRVDLKLLAQALQKSEQDYTKLKERQRKLTTEHKEVQTEEAAMPADAAKTIAKAKEIIAHQAALAKKSTEVSKSVSETTEKAKAVKTHSSKTATEDTTKDISYKADRNFVSPTAAYNPYAYRSAANYFQPPLNYGYARTFASPYQNVALAGQPAIKTQISNLPAGSAANNLANQPVVTTSVIAYSNDIAASNKPLPAQQNAPALATSGIVAGGSATAALALLGGSLLPFVAIPAALTAASVGMLGKTYADKEQTRRAENSQPILSI